VAARAAQAGTFVYSKPGHGGHTIPPTWEGVLANDDIGVEVLQRAVHVLGSTSALADHLRIPQRKLGDWLDRRQPIPWDISLRAVELVVPALLTELFAVNKS
jgi:hypothetical protein